MGRDFEVYEEVGVQDGAQREDGSEGTGNE